jgi:CheY-like chemotaxis protein/two-component sensor histidine kinase
MASHELRNPRNAVASAASILDLATNAAQLGHARDVIRRQIRHLTGVLDDLLDLARITTGQFELHCRPVDLAGIVRRIVDHYAHAHRVVVEAVPVWVNGDETRLEQITVNLLTNALKYTPDDGMIHVHVGPEGDDGTLRIADTGIGIARDRLPHIFELFYHGEQPLDRRQGGLGIRLTLVKQLVTLHGGSVTAKSDGISCGSTFTVQLPRVAPAAPVPAASATDTPRASRRVLIVEDDADSREMLRLALEIAGHEVFVAEDGPRGLEEAGVIRPYAVFVDIGLPGLDGYELARQLRQLPGGRDMRILAVTGYGRPEDHQRSRLSGFDFHLVKPVDASAVERILSDTDTSPRRPALRSPLSGATGASSGQRAVGDEAVWHVLESA